MRILFAIAHYFHAGRAGSPGKGRGGHGSLGRDPAPRARALAACIASLHRSYGPGQRVIRIADRTLHRANQAHAHDIEVLVCTTRGRHLLDRLPLPRDLYAHQATGAEPLELGYACHKALRERLGIYDWYCYLEDDLIATDPLLFAKLAWFSSLAGPDCLLMPNRFETSPHGPRHKVYIDGDLAPRVTAPFQDVAEAPEIRAPFLGSEIVFRRALNPHAGCFFLSAAQMERLAAHPGAAEPEAAFVGPLESAATLGVMRAFRIYKTAPEDMAFLEIQHAGTAFMGLIGSVVKTPEA